MGDAINLEKALRLNQGIDGHLVSGHVDGQGEVTDKALEENEQHSVHYFNCKLGFILNVNS
jgi:riboflavin synthase alpha subunit